MMTLTVLVLHVMALILLSSALWTNIVITSLWVIGDIRSFKSLALIWQLKVLPHPHKHFTCERSPLGSTLTGQCLPVVSYTAPRKHLVVHTKDHLECFSQIKPWAATHSFVHPFPASDVTAVPVTQTCSLCIRMGCGNCVCLLGTT